MNDIYSEIANQMNLPIEVVKLAYESFYMFMRETIKEMHLKQENVKIDSLKTSFNIPSIGKLYCNERRLKKIKQNL